MNKLWVFGDSLSVGYNPFDNNTYLFPKENWWSTILADKLGMECENPSGVGNANTQIRQKFYENFGDIQSGDLVIFQFTFRNRIKFEPGNIDLDMMNGLVDPDNILRDEWNQMWNVFYPRIRRWLKERNINYLFWSSENYVPQMYIDEHWIESPDGGYGIWENWLNINESLWITDNGRIDRHFNEIGHQLFSEHIYKKINTITHF